MTHNQSSDSSDLHVRPVSDVLLGWKLDVVISGSIGAVESVKFIRCLRRLGASIMPWLTQGGAEFITAQAVTWAAANEAITTFSGSASHIALRDGCIIAPASASLIAKIALGMTDTPASALVASYLGERKPVMLVPNMHDSLFRSPAVQANLQRIKEYGVTVLSARTEEGKQKFPLPEELADLCAHQFQGGGSRGDVLITMGTTRGYIDDVRYVSNYSSGALGTEISKELYRYGFSTHIICGPCPIKPTTYSTFSPVETNDEMAAGIAQVLHKKPVAAVLAASVLDFIPETKQSGKIKSAGHEALNVKLVRTKKLIADVKTPIKIGFKLETNLSDTRANELAREYMVKYGLTYFVINDLSDVDEQKHRARLFSDKTLTPDVKESKADIAKAISRHILQSSTGASGNNR